MSEPIVVELPRLYENMDEATVGSWQVAVGDTVEEGDFLVELITDKTVAEFEAPCDGEVLAIFAVEKSTIPIGYALCAIGEEGAQAPDVKAENEAKLAAHAAAAAGAIDVSLLTAPKPEEPAAKPKFRAAPAARNMAKKYKIDLADVATFCGKDVIHRKDVEEFLARGTEAPESVAETTVCVAVGSADLADRVALVTGGSGGIGAAIASNLAVAGATVIVHCNANMQSAETVATAIRAAGGKAQVAQADLTDPDQCRRLVEGIVSEHGQLDILINNAGILADSVVSFMSDAQWEKVLAVNLSAPFYLTRAVAMEMARRRWGRIINIASDAGRLGSANRANYAAAKEGLVGFTRSVAREMAGMGVRVNAISPGFVETAMTAEIKDVKRKELLRAIPVRRFGRPEDVAELALFLASDRADYITGQVISVDGGLFMG